MIISKHSPILKKNKVCLGSEQILGLGQEKVYSSLEYLVVLECKQMLDECMNGQDV